MNPTSFRFGGEIGIANLAISVAHGTVADRNHTKNLLLPGTPVAAFVSADSGTYMIYGMATGTCTNDNPYAESYEMIHNIKWMGGPIFVPESDLPVCTTNNASADYTFSLIAYAVQN